MADWIKVKGTRYFPAPWLLDADLRDPRVASDIQSRQSFVSARELRLDRTSGAYVELFGRTVLLAIDRRSIEPASDEWRFIGRVAATLQASTARLSSEAREALDSLKAVVFSRSPARSYADVKPNTFVYDVDEFRRVDSSFISPAYAASNIVHDARHIWMFDNRQVHHGAAAEVACWRLQVANADALGLDTTEVNFLNGLIADPALMAERMSQDPIAKLACSASGKCEVRARG